jgi:hypothetical protein
MIVHNDMQLRLTRWRPAANAWQRSRRASVSEHAAILSSFDSSNARFGGMRARRGGGRRQRSGPYSRRAVVFRVARPTPDSVVNTERVIRSTQHSAYGRETSCEPLYLNVHITDGTTTELADGFRFVVALDACHRSVRCVRLSDIGLRSFKPSVTNPCTGSQVLVAVPLTLFVQTRWTPSTCGIQT